MKKLFVVMFVAALTMLAFGTASADWSAAFGQGTGETYMGTPVGTFDRIGLWWLSGDKFTDPGLSAFSASGWNDQNLLGNTWTGADGPAVTSGNLYFNINFQGSGTTEFLYGAANGDDIRQRQHISYSNASGWQYYDVSPQDWHVSVPNAVPEPVSTVLFLVGGATLGVRKYIKSRQ